MKDMKKIYMLNNSQGVIGLLLGLKSRITSTKPLLTMLALLMVCLFGVNEKAWGAWSGSGEGTLKNGVWYVLYEDAAQTAGAWGGTYPYTLSGPGALLTFEGKNNCKISSTKTSVSVEDSEGTELWSGSVKNSYASKTASSNCNVDATSITFKNALVTAYTFSFQKVHVTMAQYLNNPSTTSIALGSKEIGSTVSSGSVTIAWCNVPAMDYEITDDADDVFSVEVSYNSEAGKYNTATFTVTCNHTKKAGDHTAKLVITDTYGNYNKTVDLSATTTKHPNEISWTADEATKKNWGESVEMSPTASNTDYTNYPIVLTSSNTSYATVSGHKVTFLAAGEGKTVTIYANQATSATYLAPTQVSKTFTIKKSQTIVWDETKVDPNIQINKSRDITGYAYGDPSGRAITYSSADPSKISVSGNTITANGLGDVDIIATLAGDADYNEVTSRKTFTVKERETIELYFDGVIIPADGTTINLKVGETSDYVTSKNAAQPITYTSTNSGVAIYDATVHRIKALGAGKADVVLSQKATDDYQAGSRTVTVNVSLNTTTITTNVSEKTMEVGDSYDPALATNNNEVAMSITSTNEAVAVYEDGVIKAKGAGTDTITFAQAKTTKWAEGSKSIIVTVNKKDPNITISGVPATAWNTTIDPEITSANTDVNCPITITRISGVDRTARVFGNSIRVYDNNGQSAKFRVSQDGNDTYLASSKEFTITAKKANKHVTFTMDETLYNALKGSSSGIQSWNGGIMVGDNTANISNAANYDDKYMVVGPFEGVPYQLSCAYSCSGGSTGKDWKIYESSDGSNWGEAIMSVSESGTLTNRNLDPSTRYLKFFWSGNYAGYFKNIKVTERRGIEVEDYDFGNSFEVGNQATDRAIPIGWYSVPTTTVTSSNPGVFDVITETIDSRIDEFDPSTSITIRYHHKKVTEGDFDEATITLTSENGYTKTFKVKGKTNKKDQTLIWQDELTPISVGEIIPNPAIAPLALNYSIVSTTEEGVVEMDGTVLKTIKPGSVTLRVANDGDDMWNPISGDYTIKVTDLKVQRIDWDQTFTRLTTSDVDFDLTATAYEYINDERVAIDARPVTYSSDNTSVVTIVGGKLHVVGVGTANLTASVAGVAGEYEPASITRNVKVRVRSTGCTPYVLSNASYALNTIETKELSLSGEPNQITFSALGERILGFPQSGPMHFAEYYNGQWHKLWSSNLKVDEEQSFGPITLNRNTTKVKFYTEFGATCYHTFRSAYVTKAKYLELDDVQGKTSTDVSFPAEETHLGQTYIKSVVVNYSNIFDMLYVNHTNPNFRITPTEIGQGCGENGRTTITIIYYAKEAINESDVITITDEHGLMATINVSAAVSKSDQTITWNPNTNLVTTDEVTFDATASSGLAVSYSLEEGDADVATLTTSGVLTIKTAGDIHVTASQAGSETLYNSVALEPITFHISKVTPSVSVKPTVAAVTLPKTLNDVTLNVTNAKMLNDKGAEVTGTYAWVDGTTVVTEGDHGYPVRFTPTNSAWYNDTVFNVTVSASKRNQTITWDFVGGQTLPCSAIVPLNATIKDALTNELLDVELTYIPNNKNCANIENGELVVKTPGEVTITVSRAGDDTYNAASITRTITFVKTTPVIDTLPTANSIYEGQMLSESAITGGYVRSGSRQVVGSFVWTTENFKAVTIGTQNYNIQFVPSNEACYERVDTVIPMRILQIERIFTDSIGDGDWSNPDNWSNGFVPPVSNVNVTVSEDVTIDGTASVGSITIPENKDVTITISGQLTINGTANPSNDEYANVIVKDGGQLAVTGTLDVNDLIIEASLGDYTPNNAHSAASGQVSGEDKINVNGDVYFKISFDPAGKISYGWYDFTVPFEVDVMEGIYDSVGNKLTNNYDYAIMEFSEAQRAVNAKAWNWFSGTLQPGTLYSITLDADRDWNTFLFKRKSSEANYGSNTYEASCTNSGETTDRGWNGLGNGTLQHCQLNNLPAQTKIQIYDHKTDRYVERVAAGYTYAVGTAFFVQVAAYGDIDLTSVDEPRDFLAPTRERRSVEEFDLALTAEDEENAADHLWVSASEEATGEYVIGHDLVKMGTPTSAKVAQMWCARNNINLCDIEMPLVANKAQTPLSIFAPKSGSYELAIDAAPEDATLYLTKNGKAIWNLSMSPYELNLEQGTTEGYGLRIVASQQTTTDIENGGLLNNENGVRKVMIDDVIYIVTPEGKMYDIVGKGIKF